MYMNVYSSVYTIHLSLLLCIISWQPPSNRIPLWEKTTGITAAASRTRYGLSHSSVDLCDFKIVEAIAVYGVG